MVLVDSLGPKNDVGVAKRDSSETVAEDSAGIEAQQDKIAALTNVRMELVDLAKEHERQKQELKEKHRLERKKLEARQEAEVRPLQKLLEENLQTSVPGHSICCQCFQFHPSENGFICGGELSAGCGKFVCIDCCQTCDSCSDYAPFCAVCAENCLGSPDCGVGTMCADCIELHSETCESCSAVEDDSYR